MRLDQRRQRLPSTRTAGSAAFWDRKRIKSSEATNQVDNQTDHQQQTLFMCGQSYCNAMRYLCSRFQSGLINSCTCAAPVLNFRFASCATCEIYLHRRELWQSAENTACINMCSCQFGAQTLLFLSTASYCSHWKALFATTAFSFFGCHALFLAFLAWSHFLRGFQGNCDGQL